MRLEFSHYIFIKLSAFGRKLIDFLRKFLHLLFGAYWVLLVLQHQLFIEVKLRCVEPYEPTEVLDPLLSAEVLTAAAEYVAFTLAVLRAVRRLAVSACVERIGRKLVEV